VETAVMMDYIMDNPFVLSINFHDGAVVANFPWDDSNVRQGAGQTPTDLLICTGPLTFS
jgi:carboxypeptidase D